MYTSIRKQNETSEIADEEHNNILIQASFEKFSTTLALNQKHHDTIHYLFIYL